MLGNIKGASRAKTRVMEAWDRAKMVQKQVNGEPIANGNGVGMAKAKLMEMVMKRVMEAWEDGAETSQCKPIANGNGVGRAKTKLMEMVMKRVMEAWDKAKVVVEKERGKMVVGEEVDRAARAKATRARGKVIKEKVAWEKAKGKMRKARVRAKPGAGARAACCSKRDKGGKGKGKGDPERLETGPKLGSTS